MKQVTIAATDGYRLSAHTFGDAATARAGVLIVPAMGVEQTYYAPFAHWLADRGYFVVTFDYRGMGHSRHGPLSELQADVFTWVNRDCAALVEYAADRVSGRSLLWIGHSLGGQVLGLLPNRDRVAAMLTVATGSGYWLQNSPALRSYVWWLWFVVAPLAVRVFGYFPGRRLRKIGDLPAGVMMQWRRWCLNREYLVGVEGDGVRARYAEVRQPILSLSFTDDEYMSARNTESLHGFYSAAPRELRRIAPSEIGVERIGHFGFFRRKLGEVLWPQAGHWLDAHVRA
jgi:predicted alpha/beta hydrolase